MLSGIRMFISGLVLLFLNKKSYQQGSLNKIAKNWKIFFSITFFTVLIPTVCKAYAIKNMLSSKAAFIGSFDPFITAAYAYFLFDEELSIKKLVGMISAFCGAVVLFSEHSLAENSLEFFFRISWPELAALTSTAVGRLGWMMVQDEMRKNDLSSSDVNGIVMTAAGFLAFGLVPVLGFLGLGDGSFFISAHFWTLKSSLLLAYTVIFGNLIAYSLYGYLLKHNSATLLSLAGATIPIYVTALGYFFLKEPVSLRLLVAAGSILCGIFIFYYEDLFGTKGLFKKR